jgi:hypothetical protein
MLLDRRILPDEPAVEIIRQRLDNWAQEMLPNLNTRTSIKLHQFPFEVSLQEPVVRALSESLHLVTKKEPSLRSLRFSCGAGTLQQNADVPPLAFAGNDVSYLGADEHIFLRWNVSLPLRGCHSNLDNSWRRRPGQ